MTEPTSYSISHVHVENFRRLELVDFEVGGDVTIISGPNGHGKSSLLRWLRQLFEGKAERGRLFVHDGADSATGHVVIVDALGNPVWRVEQELREGKADKLVIRTPDGTPTGKGQDFLKSLVGTGAAADPAEFFDPPGEKTEAGRDKKRREILMRVCPLAIDLKLVAEQRADMYAKRTQVKRDAEIAAAELSTLAKKDVPAEVDLAAKRRIVAAEREKHARARSITEAVARIDAELLDIKAKYKRLTDDRAGKVAEAEALGPAEDVKFLDDAISEGERTNVARATIIAGNRQYDATMEKLGKWKAMATGLTEAIDRLDAEKQTALAAASFPIPGIGVTEDAVLLDGKPFENASTAQRMAAAFAICAAEKPELRLALIDDAEKFDLATLEVVRETTKRLGMKTILARRSPDVADCIEIKDGRREGVPGGSENAAKGGAA